MYIKFIQSVEWIASFDFSEYRLIASIISLKLFPWKMLFYGKIGVMQYFKLVQLAPEYGPASESPPAITLLRIVTLQVYKGRHHKVSLYAVVLFSSTVSFIATASHIDIFTSSMFKQSDYLPYRPLATRLQPVTKYFCFRSARVIWRCLFIIIFRLPHWVHCNQKTRRTWPDPLHG